MSALTKIYESIGSRKRVSDTLYLTLKKAIIVGVLRPQTKLNELAIAEELDVSRASIREAIQLLCNDHYIENSAKKGCLVRTQGIEDLSRNYKFLEILTIASIEGMSIHYDIYRILMEESSHNHSKKGKNNMDRQFHMTMALCTNNNLIIEAMANTFDRLQWGRSSNHMNEVSDAIIEDHQQIIEFISECNGYRPEALKQMMKNHFVLHSEEIFSEAHL